MSVSPHQFFERYLLNYKPEAMPYLNMIMIYKMYTAHEDELREISRVCDSTDDEDSSEGSLVASPIKAARGEDRR